MNKWIVVAAQEGARVIQQKRSAGPLLTIMDFKNPESPRKSKAATFIALKSETKSNLLAKSSDTADQMVEQFLRSFASILDDAIHTRQVEKLVIIAELYMLEVLRDCLSNRAHQIVTETVVQNRVFICDCSQITGN